MPENSKSIKLYIKNKNDEIKYVSIDLLATYFHGIQTLMYHMVEDIEGTKSRQKGVFPDNTKKEDYQLVLRNASISSADVQFTLPEKQMTASPIELNIGEMAIDKLNDVVTSVSETDDLDLKLKSIIYDDNRRSRVIKTVNDIWPSDDSTYYVKIGFNEKPPIFLKPEYKKYIKPGIINHEESNPRTFVGQLVLASVDKNHKLVLDSTDGIINCTYNPLIQKYVEDNLLGNVIRVSGIYNIKPKTNLYIDTTGSIEKIGGLPIDIVKIHGVSKSLKTPLIFTIETEDDQYVLWNDDLDVFVLADTIKDAIEEINYVVEALWIDYVEANPNELTQEAIERGKKLRSLFKE